MTESRPKLIALCGSLREGSLNRALIGAVAAMNVFDVVEADTRLPPFQPELADDAPADVLAFRDTIRSGDAVMVCTPEYAMGIPGVLKNAIDWTVGSCEFEDRPCALITCTASGQIAHPAVIEVLKVLGARISEATTLLMPHNRAKIRADGSFVTPDAEADVRALVAALRAMC